MSWHRTRAPVALLVVAACGGCRPETTVRGTPAPDGPARTDSADTGSVPDSGRPAEAVGCSVVDVQPRTIPDAAETEVVWSVACDALALDGDTWEGAVGEPTLQLEAASSGGGVTLTAIVSAGSLGPGLHDLGTPSVGGLVLDGLRLAVRVHATEDAVATALRGEGWNAWAGSPASSRSFYLGDPDGNRVLDLLSTAVLATGEVVQHAQQANGQGAFQDRQGLAHVEADGFVSGEGFWFESDTEGVLSLVAATEPGQVAHVRKSTFVGRDWTETVLRVNHGFMGERVPDVLLAAEPEWYAPDDLLVNLLGLVDRGGDTVGLYCEGCVCWEWESIAGLTPADVASGAGFLGAFTDGELGALQPATSHPKFWSVDLRDPASGLPLGIIDYDYHTENWDVPKAFLLPDPGFAVEAVSGAGHDLDGDGSWELVLELWGEGAWQAWLVRGADDKADDRQPVLLGATDARALWGSAAPAAEGASVLVPSTFVANGRALRSTRLVANAPSVEEAGSALVVVEEWSLPAVLDGAATTVAPEQGAVVGRVDLHDAGGCTSLQGEPLPACRRGMLPQSVAAAGAEGSPGPLDPYWEGDHLVVWPGEGRDRVLVSRGVHPAGVSPGWLPAASTDAPGSTRVGWDGGLRLVAEGEDRGALCHAHVQVVTHPDGAVVAGQSPADCLDGTTSLWWPDGSTQRFSVPGGATPSGATLLASLPSPDGTWPVMWRTPGGQAGLGALSLAADAAPTWSGDPLMLDAGGDPALLSLGPDRPGLVVVRPGQEADWPAAVPSDGWGGEPLPVAHDDPFVVAAVASPGTGCPWQSAVLVGSASETGTAPLFESEDPGCADLPVPLAAGRVDGAVESLVSASASGRLVVTRFQGTDVWHQEVDLGLEVDVASRVTVSVGDVNGDGLADLLVSRLDGLPARVLLSDGQGGWLPAEALAALGGGRNAVGLAVPAPGRPAPAPAWDGTLPALQRAVVPVVAP